MNNALVTVYHGDDIVSSRKAFLEHLESFKGGDYEVLRIDGRKIDEETLENASGSSSLFGQKRILAIENLLSGRKGKENIDLLKRLFFSSGSLVFWEGKELGKTDCLAFPKNSEIKIFKIPAKMYNFLDSILPGRKEETLSQFNQIIESTDVNFLFLMLIRQFRLLIMAKDEKTLSKMASWQSAKLKAQSARFEKERLYEIYRKLLDIDYRQKTSSSPFDLKASLDLLLLDI